MKLRTTIAGTGLSAVLTVIGCGSMVIFASAALSACSGSGTTPSGTSSSFSPGASGSQSPATSGSSAAAAPAASGAAAGAGGPASPAPASDAPATASGGTAAPAAAPATGGGGTAGFQHVLLLAVGGVAVLAGAGSLAYRRKIIRNR